MVRVFQSRAVVRALAMRSRSLFLFAGLLVLRSAHAQEPARPVPSAPPAAGPTMVPGEPVRVDTSKPSAPPPPNAVVAPGAAAAAPTTTTAPEAQAPKATGDEDSSLGASPSQIYSEDWWAHTKPVLELHGYLRTRGEMFHQFSLGQPNDPNTNNLWPQPFDNSYVTPSGAQRIQALCGTAVAGPDGAARFANCEDRTQAFGNMRFRLNPELHISDNLRIMAQVDALDNLVLGSTSENYSILANTPNPNARNSIESTSQGAPTAGVNGFRNSIDVKRAWAEYVTPFGQLRFGRMPFHWGRGMLFNSGDQVDQDWQTNVDRIMFASGLRSMDLYFGGAWDFASTGPTSASPYDVYGGQPYNLANRSNVGQWTAFVLKRTNPELQRLSLARGDVVVNGGLLGMLKLQELDVQCADQKINSCASVDRTSFARRGATIVTVDAWGEFRYKKLHAEIEGAVTTGQVELTQSNTDALNPATVLSGGVTGELDYRAVDDKLRLAFGSGWASGDPGQLTLSPGPNQYAHGPGRISMFRMSPAYNIDLILHRRLLQRVQGTYYFRPNVEYDFIRNPNGQRFGGNAAAIWTRASEFVQTPGHKSDLGVELNLSVFYQAKDGSLNDNPQKQGGFYAMLQWGILFPLSGMDSPPGTIKFDTTQAQTARLHLGVVF
jgi:uncharacterized protein (TIGR04551 family)